MSARGHRDRHGRGLRRPLAPPGVPLSRTRTETFADLAAGAVERLRERWPAELAEVTFAVADVPPAGEPAADSVESDGVLLSTLASRAGRRAIVVLFRRPIELRAADPEELADLVHDVVVEQVAALLDLDPGVVDPGYGEDEDG